MTWEKVKLSEVLTHRKGSITISDKEEYKLCRVKLHRKGVVLRELRKGLEIKTKKQQVCKANDFIVAEMDAKVGGYGFIPEELQDAIVSSHYYLFELNNEKIRKEFLDVICQTSILQDQIKAKGSTNYAAIRPSDVLSWEVNLPPLDKQLAISKRVLLTKENVRETVSELSHQMVLVNRLRQAFLREAMQGKLIPQDERDEPAAVLLERIKAEKAKLVADKKIRNEKPLPEIKPEEIPFDIPNDWAWCRLGDTLTELLGGFAFESTKYVKDSSNQVIRLGNVKNDNLVLTSSPIFVDDKYAESAQNAALKAGDILITMTGTRAKRDYLFSLLLSEEHLDKKKLFLNQRVACFRLGNFLSKEFVNIALKDRRLLNPVFESATGAANQANIGITALKSILLPLPPLDEQMRIVEKLQKLMTFCDDLEDNIRQSKTEAETLLQVALKEALEPR